MDSKYDNKIFCYLGDSITEGVGVRKGERYFDYLSKELGFNAICYGVNGAQTIDVLCQIDKMILERKDNVDFISLFIGTNDYNAGVEIGKFFEESEAEVCVAKDDTGTALRKEKRMKRSLVFDEGTFCGRLNRIMKKLKDNYPNVETVMMTPIHRAFACFGNGNIQYDEMYSNNKGLYIDDYVNAIRKCADIWAIKLIDLYRESGLYPINDLNAKEYFCDISTDRLHPNAKGHEKIAKTIIKYY